MATARSFTYSVYSGENVYGGMTPKVAHVFIESGQSNSQGRGALVDSPIPDNALIGNVKTWRRNLGGEMYTGSGQWYGLEYDTNQYEGRNEFGSVLKFAIHLRDNLEGANDDIYIIKADANGKPISGWLNNGNEGDAMYNGHIAPALADLQANTNYDEIRIHGFFFDQGEADSGTLQNATDYQAKLQELINDVRSFVSISNLPILVRRIEGSAYAFASNTAASQEAVALVNENMEVITGAWTYMDAGSHLDGVSQNQVGDDRYTLLTGMTARGYKYG